MESRTYRGSVDCQHLGQALALRLDGTLVTATANGVARSATVNVDYFEDTEHRFRQGALTIKISRSNRELTITILDRSPDLFAQDFAFQSNDDIEDMVLRYNLFSDESDLRDEFMIDFQIARLWKLVDDFLTDRDCVQIRMDLA